MLNVLIAITAQNSEGADSAIIENNIIYGNSAASGGGIACNNSSPLIRNNLLILNSSTGQLGGGAVYIFGTVSNPLLASNTISGNTVTSGNGGGIYVKEGTALIKNCILWQNQDDLWNCAAIYSDVTNLSTDPGTGNLSVNPAFIQTNNPDAPGYYRLSSDSPCINMGDPSYIPAANETDIDGEPRITEIRIDIGADELTDAVPPDTQIVSGPAEASFITSNTVTFTWSGNDNTAGPLTYSYNMDGSGWSSFDTLTTHTFISLSEGPHTFSVKAKDQAGNEDPSPTTRNFTIDTTPPSPASDFRASATPTGIRLDWSHSPSSDIHSYRLYWDNKTGTINYGAAYATIYYPSNYFTTSIYSEGTYKFGLRAVDKGGNEEDNTTVVVSITISGFNITINLENSVYDRGQDVPISGTVTTLSDSPIANIPVTIDIESKGYHRYFTAYTDASGVYRYTFHPLSNEAGSYTARAKVMYEGLEKIASANFTILGLLMQPANVTVDMSMNSSKTINLTLKNIGSTTLTGLQYSIIDNVPGDLISGIIETDGLPSTLNPGATISIPVVLTAADGPPPATAVIFSVNANSTEGSQETTIVTTRLHEAVSMPQISPDPLVVGVRIGEPVTKTAKLTNKGYASMHNTVITVHDQTTYHWITIINGNFGLIGPSESKEFQIYIDPPADLTLGTYVVQLDLSYDGTVKPVYLTVQVTTATSGQVAFKVYDDTGSVVSNAEVNLISKEFYVNVTPQGTQEYNNVIKGSTDNQGYLLFVDVPVGEYRYLVDAQKHDQKKGEIIVEPGTTPQTITVIMVTNLVDIDFSVTPTTIQDQYSVTLNITYATNLTKPTLYANPSKIDLSFFPEEIQEGVITITNTSNNAPVRNILIDATKLDPVDQEVLLVFSNGMQTMTIDTLAPKENIQIAFRASIPNGTTAKLNSRNLGNIIASGNYTFSLEGNAYESTTTTPIPVLFWKPQDLSLPSVSYVNDELDGNLNDLEYQGNTYRLTIKSNRDITFSNYGHLKAVTHINGGPDNASIITSNDSFWNGNFNRTEPLTYKGDVTTFDITGLEESLESLLSSDRTTFLSKRKSIGFFGTWTDRGYEDAYLIPISITTIRQNEIIGWYSGGSSGWFGGTIPTVPLEHGEVKIQIDQKVTLGREAFNAQLSLKPTVSSLNNVNLRLNIKDKNGNDASSLFFVIVTHKSGISSLEGGTISGPADINWQLIPSSEAGGTQPEGLEYDISASVEYSYDGDTYSYNTQEETVTVKPMPKLILDYYLPYVIMAGKPVKIKVKVTNQGFGPAQNLVISSAQPKIVENLNNIPISFVINGSSPTSSGLGYQEGALTINFGDVPPDGVVEGYWLLTTTKDGYFIEFTSTLKHENYLGIELDPLIEAVNTHFVPAIGGIISQTGECVESGLIVQVWQNGVLKGQDTVNDTTGAYFISDLMAGNYVWIVKDLDGNELARRDITVLGEQPTSTINEIVNTESIDTDSDGLPDCWEIKYFGNLDEGPDDDYDNDGLTNLQEYQFGTDPTVAQTGCDILSGTLRDAITGNHLSSVNITVDGLNTRVTDANGFYFFSGLSCGTHIISVSVAGYAGYARIVDTSTTNTLNILLTKTSTVYGPQTFSGYGPDPVNTATGNYIYRKKDFEIPGRGLSCVFERTYNSQDGTDGHLGYGWNHNYNATLTVNTDSVVIRWGDGKTETWMPDGSGGYTPQYGVFDTLIDNGDGTYSLKKKDLTRYNFNTSGKLASIVDRNSNTIDLTYSDDNLTRITDTVGRAITFTYDANNHITLITDPIGRTLQFIYDANGDLVSAEDMNGNITAYTYDARHQMLTATDPRGNTFVTNVYDDLKRVVTSQRDAKGGQTTYTYDEVNSKTTIVNQLGYTTVHYHDEMLGLIQEQDALGNSAFYTYDTAGNRIEVKDKNGNITRYTYDSKGNVLTKTDALNNVTTITYDSNNNPLSRTDALGKATTFEYDTNGNLIKTTDPLGNFKTVTYGSYGLPQSITDARGDTTTNAYDTEGNLIEVTNAIGNKTTYTYDGVGRMLTTTDALGRTKTYAYDNSNNLLTVTDPLGNVTTYTYDANNNNLTVTDPMGNTTSYVYDVKDLLATIADPSGGTITYTYDALDRKTAVTDKRGNKTTYVYDAVGNLTSVTDALGQITTYTYDANGNKLTETNPLGKTFIYAYDVLNRAVSITDLLGNAATNTYDALDRITATTNAKGQTTSFQYDAMGRLKKVTDSNGGTVIYTYDENGNRLTLKEPNGNITSYAYDALNRLAQKVEPLGSTSQYSYDTVGNRIGLTDAKGNTINYTYDANNRLTVITYPDASNVTFAYNANGRRIRMVDGLGTSTYEYDVLNRMTSSTDPFGKTVSYGYDANGNRTSLTYPDGKIVNYVYDSLNRLITVTDWLSKTTTYTYDTAGNLTAILNPNNTAATYTYDSSGRLTGLSNKKSDATVISNYSLTIDAIGNHTSVIQTEPLAPVLTNRDVAYTYDTENRLTDADSIANIFDANGNMTARGSDTFTYDYNDRLIRSNIGGVVTTYSYDGLGNRLVKTKDGTTKYVLDVNGSLSNVLTETDESGTITAYYLYGLGLVSKILPDGTAYYYHYDLRGSTVALSDASENLTDKYAYDTFGRLANSEGIAENPFKYVGRYGVMDEGNGLKYIRARYYAPELGRFITKDLLAGNDEDGQSLNRYVYALNNPVRLVDVSGFSVQEVGISQNIFGSSDPIGDHIMLIDGYEFPWWYRWTNDVSPLKFGIKFGATQSLKAIANYLEAGGVRGIPINFSPLTGRVVGQTALQLYHPQLTKWVGRLAKATPFISMAVSSGLEYLENKNKEMDWTEKAARVSFEAAGSALTSTACFGGPWACAAASATWEATHEKLYETIVEKPGEFIGEQLYEWGHGKWVGNLLGF